MADFYILYSARIDSFYIGSSHDAEERLIRHNKGHQTSTRKGIPWKLVYKESFATRQQAYSRE
ncbi:MAG: GIY-YIG nuclease family protein [Chitinophagales bacterium]